MAKRINYFISRTTISSFYNDDENLTNCGTFGCHIWKESLAKRIAFGPLHYAHHSEDEQCQIEEPRGRVIGKELNFWIMDVFLFY